MSKINLPPFYVGQKVMYITGRVMPKNSVHKVTECYKIACGCWALQIDTDPPNARGRAGWTCHSCKTFITDFTRAHWNPNSFRAIQERPVKFLTFDKIKEEEKEEILTLN